MNLLTLCEKNSEEKLVRKILRYLPKRFDMNVTTIEGAQDISSKKVEKVMVSLGNRPDKKHKEITLESSKTNYKTSQMKTLKVSF